ncbi:unnamed protein product [Calypogeia fissa]
MDDAQGIVLLALQRAGVELPEDVHSVGDLHPQQLVPIYAHALTLLRGGPAVAAAGIPTEFPQQRADRFRVCADLVVAFQQLGYRGELSFHQFLYPSEADTHRLLRFLLDQLSQTPTSAGKGRSSGRRGRGGRIGADDFGGSKISGTVRHALSLCWDEANNSALLADGKESTFGVQKSDSGLKLFEPIAGDEEVRPWGVPFRTSSLRLFSARGTNKKQPPLITIQAKPRVTLVPSVLELNSRTAEKSARLADAQLAQLARQADKTSISSPVPKKKIISGGVLVPNKEMVKSPHSTVDSAPATDGMERSSSSDAVERKDQPEASAFQQRAEISKLETDLATITIQAEKMVGEIATVEAKGAELKEKIRGAVDKGESLDQRHLLLKEAVDLAVDESRSSEAVLQDLELNVQEGYDRLQALQTEWDAVRNRLEEKVADSDKNAEARNSEIQTKLRRMREMRQEVKDMTAKMWAREGEESQLSAELDKTAKGASRATYVRRITELIRNSKKQDADIARIIHDTRELQRESNMSQDKLRRLHALVDETVFRDAKRDPVCRQAYRLLSTVHGSFENIVAKVLEMDKIGREISELQAKLEDLEKRPLDTAGVQADLDAILGENKVLERKLQEAARGLQ